MDIGFFRLKSASFKIKKEVRLAVAEKVSTYSFKDKRKWNDSTLVFPLFW